MVERLDTRRVVRGRVRDLAHLRSVVANACRDRGYRVVSSTLEVSAPESSDSFGDVEGQFVLAKSQTEELPTFDPTALDRRTAAGIGATALLTGSYLTVGLLARSAALVLTGIVLLLLLCIFFGTFAIPYREQSYENELLVAVDGERRVTSATGGAGPPAVLADVGLVITATSTRPKHASARMKTEIDAVTGDLETFFESSVIRSSAEGEA